MRATLFLSDDNMIFNRAEIAVVNKVDKVKMFSRSAQISDLVSEGRNAKKTMMMAGGKS